MSLYIWVLTAGVLFSASVLWTDGAYGQTTFNATFESSPASACGTDPGCTNFTSVLGGVSFSFVFTSDGGGGDLLWENSFGEGNSGSINCISRIFNLSTVEVVTIRRTDNQLFNFTSIFINNDGGSNVTVAAYRGGGLVGDTQFVSQGTETTYSFGGIQVDEVRISGSDLINTNFDSFKGSIPSSNASPVVTLSGGSTAATEQVAIAVDNQLTVSDSDNGTLASATVSISGNFQSGQDVLSFTNSAGMGNISGAYNAGTGVLTLISSGAAATVAQWQTALRSVTYTNTSNAPNTGNRTITFVANDGTAGSAAVNKTLGVTAVNDAPVLTVPGNVNVTRGQATAITGISGADADAGSAGMTLSFSAASGAFSGSNGGGVTVNGSGSGNASLTGSIANVNAYIAGSNLSYTSASSPPPGLQFSVALSDNGNTGAGGMLSDSETVNVTVVPPASVGEWSVY